MDASGAALCHGSDGQICAPGFVRVARCGYKHRRSGEQHGIRRFREGRMKKMTGAEILCETLVRLGVKHLFGYPGGAILPTYDALGRAPIHHVLVRHEQGATHMADGYARASGQVGVAVATSGPGATNMVTGIATAMLDSSPIVCITGQVSSKLLGSDAFQETDITGITMPITKHNVVVSRAEDVARSLREAFVTAASGRPGPVLVDVTKDAQQSACEFHWEDTAPKLPLKRYRQNYDEQQFARAVEFLNTAKRPVILAGHGILISGAMRVFQEFVRAGNFPVAMTLLGLGAFPASEPLNLGMMGMHGEAWVNHAIQDADLLIAVGMRFDDRVTGDLRTYAQKARKIHIEVDRAEINKNVKVDAALIGDAREVLEKLLPRLEPFDRSEWVAHISNLKGDSAVRDIQSLPDSGHRRQIRPAGRRSLGRRGRRRLPDDHVRASHHRPGKAQRENRHHQQRLSRNGPPMAGVLLRQALRRHAARRAGLCRPRQRLWRPRRAHNDPQRSHSRNPRRARSLRNGSSRLPRRAGRFRLPDGSRRRFSGRDDSPAQPACRNVAGTVR